MSVLVVGSIAIDTIRTPTDVKENLLGGSASHAAICASFFTKTQLVGVVGDDFPKKYINLFLSRKIDLAGLKREHGNTFHWDGKYEKDPNKRSTLVTELGVFENFKPDLPQQFRASPFVLLANISPSLQLYVLDQIRTPRFVVADTMDLWIKTARPELLKLLRRIDAIVINDSEAKELVNEDNLIHAARLINKLGPKFVIIKKGEHGSILYSKNDIFILPAYPLLKVVDPTGAGDSFLGALVGWLASKKDVSLKNLKTAMVYGTIVASFCCEGFGLDKTSKLNKKMIYHRLTEFKRFTRF